MFWKRPAGQREHLTAAMWPRTRPCCFRDTSTPRRCARASEQIAGRSATVPGHPATPPRRGTGLCAGSKTHAAQEAPLQMSHQDCISGAQQLKLKRESLWSWVFLFFFFF